MSATNLIIRWSQVRSLPGPQGITAGQAPVSAPCDGCRLTGLSFVVGSRQWALDSGLSTPGPTTTRPMT